MLIHHYDPTTRLYLGFSTAEPDPLELEREQMRVLAAASSAAQAAFVADLDDGATMEEARAALALAQAEAQRLVDAVEPTIFLIPAHATDIAPEPFTEGQCARWNDEAWTIESLTVDPVDPEPEDELTEAELAELIRQERTGRIALVRYLVDRHRDEIALGRTTTLTNEDYLLVLQHIQDLRDVPEQEAFPTAVEWPLLPPELLATGA